MRATRVFLVLAGIFLGIHSNTGLQNELAAQQRAPAQAAPTFVNPVDQNKALAGQVFNELFSQGRYELIDKIYHKDCVVHFNNRNYRLEESVTEGKGWRSASPDLQMLAEQINVQGDLVYVRWVAKGTNTGRGNGIMNPTGRRIVVQGNSTFRVANGKIVEVWNNYNRNEIFRQLGIPPTFVFWYEKTEDIRLALSRFFSGTSAPPER